jgi:AbrB family looped-hinge helix DNA binding protein
MDADPVLQMGSTWNQKEEGVNLMFKDNLVQMRKINQLTQEDIAEKLGVTRQSVAKWEAGESIPDLDKCKQLADIFGVSLDDLANYEPEENLGLGVPPKGKHLFGMVTVGDKGQIVIPAKARKLFDISSGDQLIVLGDEMQGLAIIKSQHFLDLADAVRNLGKK